MRPGSYSLLLRTGQVSSFSWIFPRRLVVWRRLPLNTGSRFRNYCSSPGGVDLETEYNSTLSNIVQDHQQIFDKHFEISQQQQRQDNSQLAHDYDEIPQFPENIDIIDSEGDNNNGSILTKEYHSPELLDLTLDNETTHKVRQVLRAAAKSLNRSYQEVKQQRSNIPRSIDRTPVKIYNDFLRSLYNNHGLLDYRKLFKTYNALPYPPPFHIKTQHLEDLIGLLMNQRGEIIGSSAVHGGKESPKVFLSVLADLVDCGMPISAREYNSAMSIIGKSISTGDDIDKKWPLIEDRLAQLKKSDNDGRIRDVSTLNILISIALKIDRKDLLNQLVQEFDYNKIKPDRYTMLVYMVYQGRSKDPDGVRKTYQQIKDSGYVIDISLLNLMMKCLLESGDQFSAEEMFTALSRQQEQFIAPRPSSKLTKQIHLMDYLIDITKMYTSHNNNYNDNGKAMMNHRYEVPLIPDYDTYNIFLTHYCIEQGDFEKAMKVVKQMVKSNLATKHTFYNLYKGFSVNQRSNNPWTIEQLKYVTEYVRYHQEQSEENLYTFVMAEMALKAFSSVTGLRNDPIITELNGMVKRRTRDGDSRQLSVHRILMKLSTSF